GTGGIDHVRLGVAVLAYWRGAQMGIVGDRDGGAGISGLDGNDETMAVREESKDGNGGAGADVAVEAASNTRRMLEEALKILRAILVIGALVAIGGGELRAQTVVAPGTGRGLPETVDAIDSARVT